MKNIKNIIIIWGYLPYTFVITLLVFYFHVGLLIGELPQVSVNDPKNFEIYQYYSPIINLSLNLMFYTFALWIFLSIYFDREFNFKINRKHFVLIFSGYIFSIILFFSNIMTWFVD